LNPSIPLGQYNLNCDPKAESELRSAWPIHISQIKGKFCVLNRWLSCLASPDYDMLQCNLRPPAGRSCELSCQPRGRVSSSSSSTPPPTGIHAGKPRSGVINDSHMGLALLPVRMTIDTEAIWQISSSS